MQGSSWDHAALALKLLALDPAGLGGAVIRMRASPARDSVLAAFSPRVPVRKMPVSIADEQLFGGLDLGATLAHGRPTYARGFFATPCVAVIPMAERCAPELAAKIGQLSDQSLTIGIVALDEGIEPDERVPDSLADRLAFHIDPLGRMPNMWPDCSEPDHGEPIAEKDAQTQLAYLSARFGITSLRAPLLALRAARAHATLVARTELTTSDITMAAALVLAHRATVVPKEMDATNEADQPQPDQQDDDRQESEATGGIPNADMLLSAVAAMLPPDLLERVANTRSRTAARGSGAGKTRMSNRRGRPLPPRPGRIGGNARIDLVATLRAAAPWQPLRRAQQPDKAGLLIRPSDIQVRRFAQHSDRVLIFSVDASGSAAIARLGEAKGAIELLLTDAYASRDHVALISFRGAEAETLLPPTRSLVQTKRRLSALPGGGGTPLAAGLHSAMSLASQSASKGMTPTIIVLTDGRANIALDGTANRRTAAADADTVARAIRAQGTETLLIDMSNRPQSALQELGRTLDGAYVALPRADAHRVTQAVTSALGA